MAFFKIDPTLYSITLDLAAYGVTGDQLVFLELSGGFQPGVGLPDNAKNSNIIYEGTRYNFDNGYTFPVLASNLDLNVINSDTPLDDNSDPNNDYGITITVIGPGTSLSVPQYLDIGSTGAGNFVDTGGFLGVSALTLSNGSLTLSNGASIDVTTAANVALPSGDVGELTIGAGSKVSSGGGNGGNYEFVGAAPGSSGTVSVTGAGAVWSSAGQIIVGNSGTGSLTLSNNASVSAAIGLTVGQLAGSSGNVVVKSGANLGSLGSLDVIGSASGSLGTVDIDGAGSAWSSAGEIVVGNGGAGSLTLSNNASVSAAIGLAAGQLAGSSGNVVVESGASLGMLEAPQTGQFTVSIGSSGTGSMLVTGANSVLDTGGNPLSVGEVAGGSGSLTVADGGRVYVATQDSNQFNAMRVGRRGDGTVTVTGADSQLIARGYTVVGRAGHGTLTVENGGTFLATADAAGGSGGLGIGSGSSSNATDIGGVGIGTVSTGGLLRSEGGIGVGSNGVDGTLAVSSGGTVEVGTTLSLGSSHMIGGTLYGSDGVLTITTGGVVFSDGPHQQANASITIGAGSGSTGTVVVDGVGSSLDSGGDTIFVATNGTGYLTISDGGVVRAGTQFSPQDYALGLATKPGVSGFMTVTGSGSQAIANGAIQIGSQGTGVLDIMAGGLVTATSGGVGRTAAASGTITVSGEGSELRDSGSFYLAQAGSGAVRAVLGGLVEIGTTLHLTALGTLDIDDSGMVEVGGTGHAQAGMLVVDTAGTVTGYGALAAPIDNSGVVDASNGTLALSGAVSGVGTLAIEADATLVVGAVAAGQFVSFHGTGTLRLDDASAFAGTINFGTAIGNVIDLQNIAFVPGGSVFLDSATDTLTVIEGTITTTLRLSRSYSGLYFHANADATDGSTLIVFLGFFPCYLGEGGVIHGTLDNGECGAPA